MLTHLRRTWHSSSHGNNPRRPKVYHLEWCVHGDNRRWHDVHAGIAHRRRLPRISPRDATSATRLLSSEGPIHTLDCVVLYNDRIVIPPSLRSEVLRSLHSAHQGTSSMTSRAEASVYWPGITSDIHNMRARCSQCNRMAPSQPNPPRPHKLCQCTHFRPYVQTSSTSLELITWSL